ncbi:MAG TPA: hypothetical protein VFT53_02955 [Candidatus Saccharimonadales bacterium]|nr:hypothetical protein [Candidatus Saccharimonadales bacterium]
MIIIDSNTVIACFNDHRSLAGLDLVVPDDLYEEYLAAEVRHGQKINGIRLASTIKGYDEAAYLRKYAEAINGYSHISFDKMRGLGDVSILALVACLVTNFDKALPQIALNLGESAKNIIRVVTDDNNLRKKLQNDFGEFVEVVNYEEFCKP